MASPGGADGPARTTDSPNSRSGQTAGASWRVPVEGRPDASTAHTPQQSDLPSPPRLPGAAGAVQGGVGAVVGGDCTASRRPPRDAAALEEGTGSPQHAEHDGAGGPGETLWPRPPVHRLGSRRSGERLRPQTPETQKGRHTWPGLSPSSPHPHPVTPALPYGSGCIIIEASLAAVP